MALEDFSELEELGRVISFGDSNGGCILTIHVKDEKRTVAPMVAASYFGKRSIPTEEFSYSSGSGELKIRYRCPKSE